MEDLQTAAVIRRCHMRNDFGFEFRLRLGADLQKPFSAQLYLNVDMETQTSWSLGSLAFIQVWKDIIGHAFPNGRPIKDGTFMAPR